MSAAYFIVLERKIDGLDAMMNGKSLSKHMKLLDQAAGELDVTPLSEFYSIDPEQAAEFWADEGIEPGDIKLPPLEQFSAQAGLAPRVLSALSGLGRLNIARRRLSTEKTASALA